MKTSLTTIACLAMAISSTNAANLRKLKNIGGGISGDLGPFGGGGSISGCFSEFATVLVDGHDGPVEMKQLQLGDRILTASGAYEPIYTFGHYHKTMRADFLQIQTEQVLQPLEITGEHMVFLQGKTTPVRADSVQVGDILKGFGKDMAKVSKIDIVTRTGLYAPLTASGTLVVDGIQASAYISLQDDGVDSVVLPGGVATPVSQQALIHMGLSPLRILCLGISDQVCQTSHDKAGIQNYVALGMQFMQVGETWPVLIQILVLAVVLLVSGAFFAVESIFGASSSPMAMLIMAGAYVLANKFNISIRASKIKSV